MPKRKQPMTTGLEGVVVCITGDPTFDKDQNKHVREQFTDENVKEWLSLRSGLLVEEVTKATTHLISSRKAYSSRAANGKIKAARKLGCHIVTYEWLADTLQLVDRGHNKKASPELYHPGKDRDGEAISDQYTKREKKAKPVKEKALTAAVSTTASGGDGARATMEGAHTQSEQSGIPKVKSSQKSSEKKEPPGSFPSEESKGTRVVGDSKKLCPPADNKSHEPAGKPKDRAKVEDQEPRVDLSRFVIYRDESGLHQATFFENGRRCVLELYESKSDPKTYLFGQGEFPKPRSSECIRYFPSKTPRDKEHELRKFRSRYWRYTGKRWCQRNANRRNESNVDRQARPLPKTATGSANHKNKFDELRKAKKDVAHRHGQVDMKTSSKRKSSFSEQLPAKELKVTKHSVAGGSGKTTND